ncbi:MAG TPA: AAA family ATPase, partial [Oligoflexia bacterium]|nr:AAA family ATPase [Oligoflexia bacterium]
MLSVIRIKNFAIVEEVELEFGPGLNVITGETGAGKSIILKAIELLTGRRVSSDIVRSGAEQCIIEGLFELSASARAQLLDTADDAAQLIDGDEVLVRRVIDRSGRSKTYVNGSIVTAGLLQALTQPLLDLTGQHEHQRLLDAAEHLNLLDQFGVDAGLRQETASAYAAFAKAKKILETFKKDSEQSRRYFEHLQEEKKELDMAAIQPGERDELEQELKRLANFEALSSQVNSSLLLLEDDTEGIETRLQKLSAVLSHSAALDTELAALLPLVDSAAAQLSEARIILAGYGSSLECEPGRLEYLRERIAEIARLERKYDKKSDELLRYQQQITEAINEIGAQAWGRCVHNLAWQRGASIGGALVAHRRVQKHPPWQK